MRQGFIIVFRGIVIEAFKRFGYMVIRIISGHPEGEFETRVWEELKAFVKRMYEYTKPAYPRAV